MYDEIFKTGVIDFIGDIKMCLTSHWLIIFNIRVSSCACELRTDLIFLWIKVSSVIQTLSAAHIKGEIPNLPINTYIITSGRPSQWTWFCIHSNLSEFSLSLTPSFTWLQSSSALVRASFRFWLSGWPSGVYCNIFGEKKMLT
jgi:hypothetical protein